MVNLSKQTKSDDTRIIVRNRVYPDRGAIFKLYSWKRALNSQCGFSTRRHRIRCKLSLSEGSQQLIYVSCEKQFVAAIDMMSKNGADLEFELVHKFEWLHEKINIFTNGGRRPSCGSDFSGTFEKSELD
ncbi:hypothetical protein ABOM_004576 [Aspergillus bombycis]|uniref:Uncharacterized protein n=1 Tax=Aspergillus bombycis TaxID=109264 RepID=A0A1F8A598_9EURO|nr:hypothetical protein ABOM_004576 [Aspergillus bombycis]OGM46478.1 hypothetical protein ABOM_004576 [Aspergillus bombycis]